jgi:hypothetical protein
LGDVNINTTLDIEGDIQMNNGKYIKWGGRL